MEAFDVDGAFGVAAAFERLRLRGSRNQAWSDGALVGSDLCAATRADPLWSRHRSSGSGPRIQLPRFPSDKFNPYPYPFRVSAGQHS